MPINAFIEKHSPLPRNIALSEADFWNEAQAAFLTEAIEENSDWCELVDELDCLLRENLVGKLAGNFPSRSLIVNGPGSAINWRAASTCSHTFHSNTPRTRLSFTYSFQSCCSDFHRSLVKRLFKANPE